MRLIVTDDAAVRRNGHLAVRKSIQRIDSLVARRAGKQVDDDAGMFGGVVIDFPDLDFAAFKCLDYRIDYRTSRLAIGYLGYREGLVVNLLALTLTAPPRSPSLYRLTSIMPPVTKSGYSTKSSPLRYATAASISSLKL